jgi:hypothetical protein
MTSRNISDLSSMFQVTVVKNESCRDIYTIILVLILHGTKTRSLRNSRRCWLEFRFSVIWYRVYCRHLPSLRLLGLHWKTASFEKSVNIRQFTWRSGGTRCRSWLRRCATSRKIEGSIPDGVIGIFHWHNPSGRTMALTKMSTRNIFWGLKAAGAYGWQS